MDYKKQFEIIQTIYKMAIKKKLLDNSITLRQFIEIEISRKNCSNKLLEFIEIK